MHTSQRHRFFLLMAVAAVAMPFISAKAQFSDVSLSSPYYDALEYNKSNGIVSGNPDGTFRPDEPINRAAFTKIVVEANTTDTEITDCDTTALSFSDVQPDDWFAPYVCVAVAAGIVRGYDDGTFKPAADINTAEAAKIVIAARDGELSGEPWYKPYLEKLAEAGAIPTSIAAINATLSRGDMAEIIYRLHAGVRSKTSQQYAELPLSVTTTTMTTTDATTSTTALATFAGGCFWCIEPPYDENPAVISAISGYAGGSAETATYSQVGRGLTDHKEAVQVTYKPAEITYQELLDIYWRQINPTDDGGQFADRGPQYRAAIFYHNDEQKKLAEASKKALADSGKFDEPIVTEILPYTTFFPAEEYHQDFYKKSADHYERYKKGSGRADYIEENWAKVAALELSDAQQQNSPYAISDSERETRRTKLDDFSYKVIAEEGTEPAYDNEYWDNKDAGIYVDKISGEPLYSSTHKYDSGTGWPSFWQAIDEQFITRHDDYKLLYKRTEVRSNYGDSHLGHIFGDGPKEHGGMRHCINSASLKFIPKDQLAAEGYAKYLYLFE